MKHLILIFVLFSFISCKTYFDDVRYSQVDYQVFEFERFQDYNRLRYLSKTGASADSETYYPQHFKIDLPKKVKSWSAASNANFIEYDNMQIIIVDAGFVKNDLKISDWKLVSDNDENEDRSKRYADSFYDIKHKSFDWDKEIARTRVTKTYTDGKSFIVFYNFKKTDLPDFEKIINTFEYIENPATSANRR